MRAIKAQNILVILLFLTIAGGVGIAIFRPDLVPVESFQKGVETIMSSFQGQKTTHDAKKVKPTGAEKANGDNPIPPKRDMYLLELKSGGRVYTDNLKTSDGTMTYITAQGLVITINAHEVIGVKKYKEGEEPKN